MYQIGIERRIYYIKSLGSICMAECRIGCRETDEACQIDRMQKRECGNPGHFDMVGGLVVEI